MGEEVKLKNVALNEHYISCPRFGGRRLALSCVHYDRYRGCRRNCVSLKKHLAEHGNLKELVEEHFADRETFLPSNNSGKNVPDPERACKFCDFVGKSVRGLMIHYRRTHNVSYREVHK